MKVVLLPVIAIIVGMALLCLVGLGMGLRFLSPDSVQAEGLFFGLIRRCVLLLAALTLFLCCTALHTLPAGSAPQAVAVILPPFVVVLVLMAISLVLALLRPGRRATRVVRWIVAERNPRNISSGPAINYVDESGEVRAIRDAIAFHDAN